MKTCIILRGLPGTGKSSIVRDIVRTLSESHLTYTVCSADDFFMRGGNYEFKLELAGLAHKLCQDKFRAAVNAGVNYVIVDNTNTTYREVRPYAEYALANGYELRFIELQPLPLDVLEKRNIHNVPRETLERMLRRWVSKMTVEDFLHPSWYVI